MPPQESVYSPSSGCEATIAPPFSRRTGFSPSSPHDQVFRNHSVGRRCSRAASLPRLWTDTLIRMSSGPSLAYSRKTSKYRSSSKTPVSRSSYSSSSFVRLRFVSSEVPVGELALRVLVEVLHVRVGRRRVDVEVVLLHVLAVVPLAVGEAERALLEDGVPLVPEGEGEAQALLVVGDPAEAVLAPPVGPGAGLVVREVVPGVAVRAVVLADRPPLPLAEVGPPLLPGDPRLAGLVQPLLLGGVHDARVDRLLACHGASLSFGRQARLRLTSSLPDPCRGQPRPGWLMQLIDRSR